MKQIKKEGRMKNSEERLKMIVDNSALNNNSKVLNKAQMEETNWSIRYNALLAC